MAGQTKFQARNREIHSDFDKIIKEIAFFDFYRFFRNEESLLNAISQINYF